MEIFKLSEAQAKESKEDENKTKKNLLKPIETSVNELVYNELRAYGECLGTERR